MALTLPSRSPTTRSSWHAATRRRLMTRAYAGTTPSGRGAEQVDGAPVLRPVVARELVAALLPHPPARPPGGRQKPGDTEPASPRPPRRGRLEIGGLGAAQVVHALDDEGVGHLPAQLAEQPLGVGRVVEAAGADGGRDWV